MWHPLVAAPIPPDVLILVADAMWDEQGRHALREMGDRRVYELREDRIDHLVDVELFAPRYDGCEAVWCDDGLTWVAYASHEGTVAFGGELAAALRRTWAGIEQWRWSPGPPA